MISTSNKHDIFLCLFFVAILLNQTSTKEINYNSDILNLHNVYTKEQLTSQQKQLLKTIHIPEIDFEVNGEFPILKTFDLFQNGVANSKNVSNSLFRSKRDVSRDVNEISLNDKQTIMIKSRIHSPLKWNDELNDPESESYKILSTSYCEFLLESFQRTDIQELQRPKCIFLQFSKGSIFLNALISFNQAINSLFSPENLTNTLIDGSKKLVDAIVNDKQFHLGFSLSGNFSLTLTNIKEESTIPPPPTLPPSTSDIEFKTTSASEQTEASPMNTTFKPQSDEMTSQPEDLNTTYATTQPVTTIATPNIQMLAVGFELVKGDEELQWDESLNDVDSEIYQNLSKSVCDMVLTSLNAASLDNWRAECVSVNFTKGSVVANVTLLFIQETTSTDAIQLNSTLTEIVADAIVTFANTTNTTTGLGINLESSVVITPIAIVPEIIVTEPQTFYSTDTEISTESYTQLYTDAYDSSSYTTMTVGVSSSESVSLTSLPVNETDEYGTEVTTLLTSNEEFGHTSPSYSETDTEIPQITYMLALNFKIKSSNDSLKWSDELLNTTSSLYRELSGNVCRLLSEIMEFILQSHLVIECSSITFKQGSIDVNTVLILTFNETLNGTTLQYSPSLLNESIIVTGMNEYIKNQSENNTFGIYIDPNSTISVQLLTGSTESTVDTTTSCTMSEDNFSLSTGTSENIPLNITDMSTMGGEQTSEVMENVTVSESISSSPDYSFSSGYTSNIGATVQTVTLVISSPLARANKSLEWSDSLLDPTSALYQEYSKELIKSMTAAEIEGLLNVTCTVIGFERGSVIGNAVLTIQHDNSSENFSTSSVAEQTVLTAIVQYTEELVTNGTDQVYFGAATNITIEGNIFILRFHFLTSLFFV
ncbi:unnamed protein product [Trichobilharzia szidati]|nr:unnamed protein product [Trichobilharzia szidati]